MRHAAIHWKTNNAPGVVIVDGQIKEWPSALGAKPTEAQISTWESEYQFYKDAADAAEEARIAAKIQAIADNLPSWAQVEAAVDNIGSLADAKVFLKKLARVTYWLARDQQN